MQEFKLRRKKLFETLDKDSVAVIFSAKEQDPHLPYRQNPDFYYLTGFIEPEAIAVLIPNDNGGKFILFNRERDQNLEIWHGERTGQEQACNKFGADQAFPISAANEILPKIIANHKKIYSNLSGTRYRTWYRTWYHELYDLGKILSEMRLRKSEHELSLIRKATEITAQGHLRAMQKCRPNMYEYELEAELLHEFTRLGSREISFPPIVAGGTNACTLHYEQNKDPLNSGELVLVDAGAKYNYYSADVSRTFPINGKFTKKQQKIYEIVLSAQLEVIKKIKPGVSWDLLQQIAEHTITTGLIDAGILTGNIQHLLEQESFKPFFMHKIGHWLGLDTHDVGEYYLNDKWRILEEGMIFTVEPGLYISAENSEISSKWLGTGVRIEDNILVTCNGYEILTDQIPKEVSSIENIMTK